MIFFKLHYSWSLLGIAFFLLPILSEAKQAPVKINGVQMQMVKELRLPKIHNGVSRIAAQFDRPLSSVERETFQKQGIQFDRYLSANAYIISGSAEALTQFTHNQSVLGISELSADVKIDASIRVNIPSSLSQRTLQPMKVDAVDDATMPVKVIFQEETPFAQAIDILHNHGVTLINGQAGYDFRQTIDRVIIPVNQIRPLANEENVLLIAEVDPPIIPCNINAQDTSNIDEIHPDGVSGYNLDGSGVTVGLWDPSGVRTTHSQLIGRATQEDGSLADHFHSTHVAGTIAASGKGNNRVQGMAPNASLLCWDSNNHLAEMDANAHRIAASNHSYTYSTGWEFNTKDQEWHWYGNTKLSENESNLFGRYSSISQAFDQVVYDRDLNVVVAAGNNRVSVTNYWGTSYILNDGPQRSTFPRAEDGEADDGYDTLNAIALGKNIITVGAIHDRLIEPPTPELDMIASWSSWGPTDDGRIKPDIVANGVKLLSLDIDDDNDTCLQSGTSMAAPVVTGGIACLVQQFRRRFNGADPSSAIMKSIILHTAQDEGTPPGPDYRIGWGLFDARAAADFINQIGQKGTQLEVNSFEGSTIEIPAEYIGQGPVKATIVWTDPPGSPNLGYLDDNASILINDLDISIAGKDKIHYPWTLDPANPKNPARQNGENHLDNVEQVYIAKPVSGAYTIRIGGQVNMGSAQIYSLCITGLRFLERETKLLILQPTGQRRTLGTTPVHLFAASESGITDIRVELDGQALDNPNTEETDGIIQFATPQTFLNHRFFWNTTLTPNGEHNLAAIARDASGETINKSISLFILNESDSSPLLLNATPTVQDLSNTNDRDWFTIQPEESGYYTIETHAFSDYPAPDTYMVLYGPNDKNKVIQEDDDSGLGILSRITQKLLSDRKYFVRISRYTKSTTSQNSELYSINILPAREEEIEPPITDLDLNEPIIEKEILDVGDVHWLRFTTPSIGTYVIEATPSEPHPGSTFQFELFKTFDQTRPLDTGTFSQPIFRVLGENQDYYIRVSAPKSKGRYILSIRTLSELSIFNIPINGPSKTGQFTTKGLEEAWYSMYSTEFTTYLMEFNTGSPALIASTAFILYGPDDPTTEIVRTETNGANSARMLLPLRANHHYYLQILTRVGDGEYTVRIRNPKLALPLKPANSLLSTEGLSNPYLSSDLTWTPVEGWMLY